MKSLSELNAAIRQYWEDPNTISIIDKNLHRIEIDTVCRYLRPRFRLADIGCGDAAATIEYAKKVRHCTGFERSDRLRKKAMMNVEKSGVKNIAIEKGDLLAISDIREKFDCIVTQRALINLVSWEDQKKAILNIHAALKSGGLYIMIENTDDSFRALNDMRTEVGLEPIPQHWHNLFFGTKKLGSFLKGRFRVLKVHDFGLYYFLTRVYVQMFASFKGFGKKAVKDDIFGISDEAARILYEKFHDRIRIGGCRALGPIQAFILRKTG